MISAHDPGATYTIDGPGESGAYVPITHDRRLTPVSGDWTKPMYGPGWERPAGDPYPARQEITWGVRDEAAWSTDDLSGVHAFLGEEGVDAHYGYQEPWSIELPNDRGVKVGQQVIPWDYGLNAPVQTNAGFVV